MTDTGFDRFMAMACDTPTIRDVIAFPKSGSGVDPLFASPAPLEAGEQRAQLSIYNLDTRTSEPGPTGASPAAPRSQQAPRASSHSAWPHADS